MKKIRVNANFLHKFLSLSILGFFSFWLISCGWSSRRKAEARAEAEKALRIQEVNTLISKWDANNEWDSQVAKSSRLLLTSQVQEALCGEGKRPIFALANLRDIVKEDDGSYIGLFELPFDYFFFENNILFRLGLSAELYKKMITHEGNFIFDRFALIIRVQSIRGSFNYSINSSEDVSGLLKGVFSPLISGECLDYVFAGFLTKNELSK